MESCPRLGEVQERTNAAAEAVRNSGETLTPQQFGTAVHKNLEIQIKSLEDPNFVAERSLIKSQKENYGTPGSVRIDVLENTQQGSVCVYDIKTGASGLSLARSAEIASEVQAHFPGQERIIVIETRPRK